MVTRGHGEMASEPGWWQLGQHAVLPLPKDRRMRCHRIPKQETGFPSRFTKLGRIGLFVNLAGRGRAGMLSPT